MTQFYIRFDVIRFFGLLLVSHGRLSLRLETKFGVYKVLIHRVNQRGQQAQLAGDGTYPWGEKISW